MRRNKMKTENVCGNCKITGCMKIPSQCNYSISKKYLEESGIPTIGEMQEIDKRIRERRKK